MKWLARLLCWFGRCTQCRIYSTDDGIGGRCDNCERIHGWVTRDELRAAWISIPAPVAPAAPDG